LAFVHFLGDNFDAAIMEAAAKIVERITRKRMGR
jgi:hypothetical protein